ncbi:hypothetical protein [Haloarcula argentinensis]|uniref:DUF8053 domain-containing protein n=1 Tax=Haloarcula argentinensis TaxID=43776 RepID=A0ABU2F5M1_HALAR|nr:hypothetical protein [Haloarcula argentinensis]EMA26727.1 hypothetical protein C443_00122 [Haloarcula argentinensis DSM 12282]MDS0255819.1 hypothetical protein [Haloarcula argentinensis]
MPNINKLSVRGGSGMVTIPKDELEMCGLLAEDGAPDTDVQLLVKMERPGEWRISVLDESCVDDSWYTGETPKTGLPVGAGSGERK